MDSEADPPEQMRRRSLLRIGGAEAVDDSTNAQRRERRRQPRMQLRFERRLQIWLVALGLPFLLTLCLLLRPLLAAWLNAACIAAAACAWAAVTRRVYDMVLRPLQTMSNVVVAMREQDYSLRARGARRGDALGDLAFEINALATQQQAQRTEAQDAVTLAERVISSMLSPVIALDAQSRIRLLNASAERTFRLTLAGAYGRPAADVGLSALAGTPDQGMLTLPIATGEAAAASAATRWSVRRTSFRLRGLPHTLFLLSDVDAALREEERSAWQRLIRVLGHEINNSLTPIKSIAGTLRSRLPESAAAGQPIAGDLATFARGLTIIEERSASLNRFLQAYQQISRLPPPQMLPVDLRAVVHRSALLESRVAIQVAPDPDVQLCGDADQMEQMLINLMRNAADAALDSAASADGLPPEVPSVRVTWAISAGRIHIRIIDNGPGLANPKNLFVPFYTTKSGGTGIGLVFAQQIAAAHGGNVRLTNRPDRSGCIAEVTLPLSSKA